MKNENKKLPTAKETLDILNKPWCTTEDIMFLTGMGRNYALNIKKEINEGIKKDGFKPLDNYVTSDKLIVYLNLNIEYLKQVLSCLKTNNDSLESTRK